MPVSWGQPAQITSARMDKTCPVCNERQKNVQYSGDCLIAGFEVSENDALCGNCGWSCVEMTQETWK